MLLYTAFKIQIKDKGYSDDVQELFEGDAFGWEYGCEPRAVALGSAKLDISASSSSFCAGILYLGHPNVQVRAGIDSREPSLIDSSGRGPLCEASPGQPASRLMSPEMDWATFQRCSRSYANSNRISCEKLLFREAGADKFLGRLVDKGGWVSILKIPNSGLHKFHWRGNIRGKILNNHFRYFYWTDTLNQTSINSFHQIYRS